MTTMALKWLNRETMPKLPFLVLCLREVDYLEAMAHLKVKNPPPWVLEGFGAVTHKFSDEDGEVTCVVTLQTAKGQTIGSVYALLVHEAVHVVEEYLRYIGERKPCEELRAYATQAVAYELIMSHGEQTK